MSTQNRSQTGPDDTSPRGLAVATGTLEDRQPTARHPVGRSVEDLTTPSPERVSNILWPIPVFNRLRSQQSVDVGEMSIRPGDVLETLDPCHREAMLVVSVLPNAVSTNPVEAADARPHLLVYSDAFQTFRVINAANLYLSPDNANTLLAGDGSVGYYLHEGVADLVESSTVDRADRTYQEVTDRAPPLLSLREQFPESFDRRIEPSIPAETVPDRDLGDVLGEVVQEDIRTYLESLPENALHCIVTSPPYFDLRDYDAEGQIGRERTPTDYLETLLGIINQLERVVHDDGTVWLVVDDVRFNGPVAGLPERLHKEIENQGGFEVLHHAPWVKANGGKPDPAGDRLADAHERVLCLRQAGSDHYFSRQAIDNGRDVFEVSVGNTDTNHDAVFPKALPKKILKAAVPERVCASCETPYRPIYEVTDIRNLPARRKQANRALELAEKHDLTDGHLEALRAVGLSDTGQSKRTQDGTGKNAAEVEELAAEAREVLGSYAREFTSPIKEQTGCEQRCGCETDETHAGVVCDPFSGSGTTLAAAKELRLRWTGCEINPDYVAEAEERLGVDVSNPEQLTDDNQATLGSWGGS